MKLGNLSGAPECPLRYFICSPFFLHAQAAQPPMKRRASEIDDGVVTDQSCQRVIPPVTSHCSIMPSQRTLVVFILLFDCSFAFMLSTCYF